MENNYFHVRTAEIEVEVRPASDGKDVIYMKFTFQAHPDEVVAPVLENSSTGYLVLKQNMACVIPGQVFVPSDNP